MKRPIALTTALGAALCLTLAACGRGDAEADAKGVEPDAWPSPPAVRAVLLDGRTLVIRGVSSPGGRVVLRQAAGEGFAVTADDQGRFEIRLPRPAGDLILAPELQIGQDAAEAPQTLVVLGQGAGPVALLRPGQAAQRLNGGGALGAVDSDGAVLVAGGRAPAGSTVQIEAGGRSLQVVADAAGQWTGMLGTATGPQRIVIDGRGYDYPGAVSTSGGAPVSMRAGQGWRIVWSLPGGAGQSTWLPDLDD
ncbi:MAG: hypothetical protein EON88_27900 [Brevundimonas sp.]|nr:MAG: hypothetical protein EON88_27900 [Brevundimonas sp.]